MNGSSSNDDGSIASYSWSQIYGPNKSLISAPTQVASKVSNLIAGIYLFELKVTDNTSLSTKDTMQLIVNTQNWPDTSVGKEFIFDDLRWELGGDITYDDVYVSTPALPNNLINVPNLKIEVFVKPEYTSTWIRANPPNLSLQVQHYTPPYVYFIGSKNVEISMYPSDLNQIGRGVSIKVKFL